MVSPSGTGYLGNSYPKASSVNSSRDESSTRVGQGLRQVGEKLLHLLRRFQMTLGVARQQTSGSGQRFVISNGGEDVAKFTLPRRRIADTIGRQQRKLQRAGNFDGGAVARFLLAMKMALQFHIDVALAKICRSGDSTECRASSIPPLSQRGGERAVIAPGQADQSASMFLQFLLADSAFAFLRPQLHLGDQAAEILVAGAGGDQKREVGRIHHGDSQSTDGIRISSALIFFSVSL